MMQDNTNNTSGLNLTEAAGLKYIDSGRYSFRQCGSFISLISEEDGKEYRYVKPVLLFPFEENERYISLLDEDDNEIGIIEDISSLSDEDRAVLEAEMLRRNYTCRISKVLSVRERFGFSYWKCLTDDGEISFSVRDAANNIRKDKENNIFISDIDENRYMLPPLEKLDRKSKKLIDIYM